MIVKFIKYLNFPAKFIWKCVWKSPQNISFERLPNEFLLRQYTVSENPQQMSHLNLKFRANLKSLSLINLEQILNWKSR